MTIDKQKMLGNIAYKCMRKLLWDNRIMDVFTKQYSDEKYLKKLYYWNTLEKLDFDNPITFTQKLQVIKSGLDKPIYTQCADKYAVRQYIVKKLGKELADSILNELYGVYENADEINFDTLNNSFVLKANHGSGMNIIVPDKSKLDINKAVKTMNKWLRQNYFYRGREGQYKNIKRKILCERYLQNADGSEIKDYKFMCFDGKITSLWVDYNRHTNHVRNFYDINGEPQYYVSDEPADYSIKFVKPPHYDEMIAIVEKLCSDFQHVRIDLYNVSGKIIFGEFTFTSWGGMTYLSPELNNIWGKLLKV